MGNIIHTSIDASRDHVHRPDVLQRVPWNHSRGYVPLVPSAQRCLAGIVLVAALTSALHASQEATVVEQAQQDLASGNFEQAIARLSGEAAHHPESPKIRALLAFAEWRSGAL
jgi:hypothetical protein